MSYYPSPPNASKANLKYYLKDEATADAALDLFYQRCLDSATAEVYYFIRRDYTPLQKKYDIFKGNGSSVHVVRNGIAAIALAAGSWGNLLYTDDFGTITQLYDGTSGTHQDWIWGQQLMPGRQGQIWLTSGIFYPWALYQLYWLQPIQTDMDLFNLGCPDAVAQVIIELAAEMFNRSSRGLGSLNTSTDFANAFGQSKLSFRTLLPEQMQRLMPFVNMGAYQ